MDYAQALYKMTPKRTRICQSVCTILAMLIMPAHGYEEIWCSRIKYFCTPDKYSKFDLPYTKQANHIGISIDIDEVRSINDDTGSISFWAYFNVEWNEPRLRVKPHPEKDKHPLEPWKFAMNTDYIKHLWVPNYFIYNLETYEPVHTISTLEGLWIDTNKNVLFSQATIITFICPMRFDKFPFDTQICKFSVGSFSYESSKVNFITNTYGYASKEKNDISLEYDIKIGPLKPQDAILSYGTLGNFTLAGFEMVLTRHSTSYIISYFLPSGLVVIISWISFLVPMDAIHGRMVLLGTLFLALVNIFNDVTSKKPKSAGLNALEIWMIACIFFVCTAFADYAALLYKKNVYESSHDKEFVNMELDKKCIRMNNFSLKAVSIIFLLFNMFFWFFMLA